jgi:hypothetical protein
MRLLHISGDPLGKDPLNISLCDTIGSETPPYMILSHRWRDEEVSFSDMTNLDPSKARSKKGYKKIESSCRIALQEKLEYAWVDTCCIDKSSSAELSEAINSMYNWYAQSTVCFAYLDDVENNSSIYWSCKESAWFTRGWTLQELIAPKRLHFYSKNWIDLGTRSVSADVLALGSGVAREVLLDPNTLDNFSVAEKMSWASKRETTRGEDEAYSLMGLFGVNMPPLYGEGQRRAFRRLQVEIMQTSHDHTLFAWDRESATGDMLAPSVKGFENGGSIRRMDHREFIETYQLKTPKLDYTMTNLGLHIQLPMHAVPKFPDLYFAFLACKVTDVRFGIDTHTGIAICLRSRQQGSFQSFERVAFGKRTTIPFKRPNFDSFEPISAWISQSKDRTNPVLSTSGQRLNDEIFPFTKIAIDFDQSLKARTSIFRFSNWRIKIGRYFEVQIAQFQHLRNTVYLFNGMYMILGSLDQRVWLCVGEMMPETDADPHTVGKALSFPFGSIWRFPNQWESIHLLDKAFFGIEENVARNVRRYYSTSKGDYLLDFEITMSELSISCSLANPHEVFEYGDMLQIGPTYPVASR